MVPAWNRVKNAVARENEGKRSHLRTRRRRKAKRDTHLIGTQRDLAPHGALDALDGVVEQEEREYKIGASSGERRRERRRNTWQTCGEVRRRREDAQPWVHERKRNDEEEERRERVEVRTRKEKKRVGIKTVFLRLSLPVLEMGLDADGTQLRVEPLGHLDDVGPESGVAGDGRDADGLAMEASVLASMKVRTVSGKRVDSLIQVACFGNVFNRPQSFDFKHTLSRVFFAAATLSATATVKVGRDNQNS
ncbi:hypothetical protein B0H19DRAFT_1075886 [Mycena capillaripes]|nr:hypothetical protein B0H19DRAFT_1075886 [Mycena capillaripes]